MKVASFFSGIGGFDLGMENAGHEVVYQCETHGFCNQILERHWPNTKRSYDVQQLAEVSQNGEAGSAIPESDIWCAGFPCQDVSVARGGPRDGLKGKRTGLFYPFAELLDRHRPPIVILENVRGLLSSHGGRDFGIILKTLDALRYGVAWRVLDSQNFGVPQSRSRLFIVGYHRDPRGAGTILLEPERSTGDSKKSRKSGAKSVSPFRECFKDPGSGIAVPKIGYCLSATSGRHTGTDWSRTYVSYTEDGKVRRLTPVEAERLQGFPDGWTLPNDYDPEKVDTLDSPRYKALGNAVSVPVIEWIGERINQYSTMEETGTLQGQEEVKVAA